MTLEDLIEKASRVYEGAPDGSALETFAGDVLDYTETVPDLVGRSAVRAALRDYLEGEGYRKDLGRDRLRELGVL
jgi:hypothetical protein